jgi:hypothetical protein
LREVAEQAEQRQAELLGARLQMAIAAGEVIARVALCRIGHVRADIGIGGGDEVAAFAHLQAMRVARQGADLGHGP